MSVPNYKNIDWLREQIQANRTLIDIAAECHIHKTTLARYARKAYPIRSIEDLIFASKVVDKISTVFSSRSREHSDLYNLVVAKTSFLPPDCPGHLRQRLWHLEHNSEQAPLCQTCKQTLTEWDNNIQRYRLFCSVKCSSLHPTTMAHRQQTNIKNRGVPFPAQSLEVIEKRKATSVQKYGVPHANMSVASTKAHSQLSSDEFLDWARLNNMTTFQLADHLGVHQSYVSKLLIARGINWDVPSSTSGFEREVADFIQANTNEKIVRKDRQIIKPLELDIVVPSIGIAVECDGMYYHSDEYVDPMYHLTKTQQSSNAGYRLIHIYDGEWSHKKSIVQSRLRAMLHTADTIPARKCRVIQLEASPQREFFNTTHLQGYVPSTVAYGLVCEDRIVAGMSFIKSRFNKQFQWELLRYSSALDSVVIGGAAKLFSHFVRTHAPTSVISLS